MHRAKPAGSRRVSPIWPAVERVRAEQRDPPSESLLYLIGRIGLDVRPAHRYVPFVSSFCPIHPRAKRYTLKDIQGKTAAWHYRLTKWTLVANT